MMTPATALFALGNAGDTWKLDVLWHAFLHVITRSEICKCNMLLLVTSRISASYIRKNLVIIKYV